MHIQKWMDQSDLPAYDRCERAQVRGVYQDNLRRAFDGVGWELVFEDEVYGCAGNVGSRK